MAAQGIDAHNSQGVADDASEYFHNPNANGTSTFDFNFVAQYIDQNDSSETENTADGPIGGSLTPTQADADITAGLQIVSIFETNGMAGSPYTGFTTNDGTEIVDYLNTNGTADGKEAVASAQKLGQPAGSAIYFAIDYDLGSPDDPQYYTPGSQQAVENYLTAVDVQLAAAGYKLGVYGSGETLSWVTSTDPDDPSYNPDIVSYTWLSGSTGWTGYSINEGDGATHGWTMAQTIPDGSDASQPTSIGPASPSADNVPVDYNVTDGDDFGAWACYCRGTLILTDRGEVPVEDLVVGDRLVTRSGEAKPLKWIGRRSAGGRLLWRSPDALPVCFKPGSLADGVPKRDLWVSPEHAMYLDGALVPAALLVNGISIVRAGPIEEVHYFHLELDAHDVIVAEGALSESFVDDCSRGKFHNASEFYRLYPEAPARVPARYCAPRLEAGYRLEHVRRLLDGRARRLRADGTAPAVPLRGKIDRADRGRIEGWAFAPDPEAAGGPVALVVLANGAEIGRVVADRYRRDLEEAGIGDGHHGFALAIPGGLAAGVRHRIEIYRADGWALLPGSPSVIEPESLDPREELASAA